MADTPIGQLTTQLRQDPWNSSGNGTTSVREITGFRCWCLTDGGDQADDVLPVVRVAFSGLGPG
ncbi:MAG: hypothetical protein AAGA65_28230 [Actinomycetota bacterium]